MRSCGFWNSRTSFACSTPPTSDTWWWAGSPWWPTGGGSFRVVDLETLIRMKEVAGRPKDLDDVAHLRMAAND